MDRRVAIIVLLAASGLAACTGSGESADEDPTTSPDSAPVATAAASSDTIETAKGPGDFCAAIVAIQTAEFELEETFGPAARELFDDVQSAAPPEISADVATVIDTLDALAELGISTDEDDPEAADAAFEILLDPEFNDANERLEEYTSATCGIDLDDDDETDLDELEEVSS